MMEQRAGRPRGSQSNRAVVCDVVRSRCPQHEGGCGSRRLAWSGRPRVRYERGTCPMTGRAFTAIRYIRKKCRECGLIRIDRERE
jgi:hypothetical protein